MNRVRGFISLLSAIHTMLFVGCGKESTNSDDIRFANEVRAELAKVCSGICDQRRYGTELMKSILALPNGIEKKRRLNIMFDEVSNVEFKGEMASTRENGYFRLRDFVGASSRVLREHGNDWGSILELWFSELTCLKKES